jgi:hypothetical protein
MDISLVQGSSTLQLNRSGVSAPVKAARFADEDLTRIEVVCEGTAAAIAGVMDSVGVKLSEAERCYGLAGENWVFVHYTLPDGVTWRSPLRAGTVRSVKGPAGRKVNSQTLLVVLDRAEYWEKEALQYCSLSNAHGSSAGAGGLTVYNHNDAGHNCFVDIAAPEGDLPAPAVLTVTKASQPNVEIWAGMGSFLDRPNVQLFLESESGASGAGVTPTNQASAAASGGNYTQLVWSGTGEVLPRYWSLSAGQSSALAGRIFRPVARLQSLIAGGEVMWGRIVLYYDNGGTLEAFYGGEYVQLPLDRLMLTFPPVQLPPWQVLNATSQAVTIAISVYEEGGGTNTINLDELFLVPLDSSLHLVPIITIYPNTTLVYDCGTGLMLNDAKSILTHLPEGPGLLLYPGKLQRLVFVFRVGNGWDINLNPTVNLQYRPRKRSL